MRARHRLSKLLLRHGIVFSGGKAWTGRHEIWLRAPAVFDNPALQLSFDVAFDAMLACLDRRNRLDDAIIAMAADSEFTPVVNRLGCMRGVATLTAFGLAVEIGDWHRLTGRRIGAYVGLVPSEYSSGDSRVQGGVTKTGNGHARRLLVEAAWHHRSPYRPGARASAPVGSGLPGGPSPRPSRQPAAAHPLGRFRCPPQASGDRQRRDCTGTGRLVLVAGNACRTDPTPENVRMSNAEGAASVPE